MDEMLERFIETAAVNRTLSITVRINDGDRYAGLDVDLQALESLLFCGAVTEEASYFVNYLYGLTFPHYGASLLKKLSERIIKENLSWVDCYERRNEFAEIFKHIIGLRDHVVGIAASDTLRLELVSFDRENPSILKIIAKGAAASIVILSLCFGYIQVIEAKWENDCKTTAYEHMDEQMKMLERMSHFEGKFSEQHAEAYKEANATLKAAIAACGSSLDSFKLTTTPEGEVEIEISGDNLRKKQENKFRFAPRKIYE